MNKFAQSDQDLSCVVVELTFNTFWANSAVDKLMICFLSQKIGYDISCKLSPEEAV